MEDPHPDEDSPGSMAGFHFSAIGRIDHRTGETAFHPVGEASATQEPVFVPRPGSVDEGDGYLIALVNRYAEMRSDLLILDATRVEDEPVATIKLPLRLRNGLHGTWIDGAALESYARDRG
jgi:carotenoid cleavage dioxygenase